ncbi:MAG: leucyl/phenylalanyl-tRNA--protein transferase [Hydrogenophilales bacterium 28-61-23]|nr:MAG: leucyl/phenylalanyl-tRNA--protein transferase [Hydrogenophilales bacterium 28-61-23]
MIPWIRDNEPFPPLHQASREYNGLLAAGGDLSVPRLLAAYRRGIFPWFNPDEPILWWSPDPRMVLFPAEFKLSRSLKKRLAKPDYSVRVDSAFDRVIRACAAPREGAGGTWISEDMIAAYNALHRAGHAHSIETWMPSENSNENSDENGEELVGGLYGVAIGRVFFGESMFMRRTDASKIALAHLAGWLRRHDFGVIDCQMNTPHLASLGAREIARAEFAELLDRHAERPGLSDWRGLPGQEI